LPSSDLSRRASSALQDRSRHSVNAKARRIRAAQAVESAGEEYGDCYGRPERRAEVEEQLGLAPYVDVLVTLNGIGLAKDAGLFGEVLERCGIRKGDVALAKAGGVLAVLFDERDGYRDVRVGEGNGEDVLRVNSLKEIGYWLQDSDLNGQS